MAISLTVLEEELVREPRARLKLALDDIVEAMRRRMNPKLSRGGTA